MFDEKEKFCVKALNFLYDNYKNIETQCPVNYFKIRVIVSGNEEFCCDKLFLNFLEDAFNNLKLSNLRCKSETIILKFQRSYSKFEIVFVFEKKMLTPDDFCRHFKVMRKYCQLNFNYSIYECFVHKFDRITITLNYKDGEINILTKKTWFDKYFKQINVDKAVWKNHSNYNLYDSTFRWQKYEKNVDFVTDRQRGPEPCTKKFHEKCCFCGKNINWEHFEKSLDFVEEN